MRGDKNSSIGVIGAGIQGVCIANFLIKKGFKVTLLDRYDPGNSASYGNAGHFSHYAALSLNRPDIISDVPSMLFSSYGPLSIKWNYILKFLPWAFKYLKNCSKHSMMHTAKGMNQILSLSDDAFDELFQEISLNGLIENNGILYFWTNKNLKQRKLETKVKEELGIEQKLLNSNEISELEPNIKKIYHSGVLYQKARHARDPRAILLKLFELFLKKGGKYFKENVETINFSVDDKPKIKTNVKNYEFDKIVIACGAFSKQLTDQANENIPLDTERGYHVHFKNCDKLINRPVIFLDSALAFSPMNQGLRAAGTVEFAGLDNPPTRDRINNIVKIARFLFPNLPKHEDEWLGFRPTLPDYLPVIGPSKQYKNLFYAFGHQHLGWTLGAITGKIISGLIAGESTNLDLSLYSSNRFK